MCVRVLLMHVHGRFSSCRMRGQARILCHTHVHACLIQVVGCADVWKTRAMVAPASLVGCEEVPHEGVMDLLPGGVFADVCH